MLQFCKKCDNLLYEVTKQNQLYNDCKICGTSTLLDQDKVRCVFKRHYTNNFLTTNTKVSKYVTYDPTLPRLRNKECIFKDCPTWTTPRLIEVLHTSHEEFCATHGLEPQSVRVVKEMNAFNKHWIGTCDSEETYRAIVNAPTFTLKPYKNEIVYVQYDKSNMKYRYICCCCGRNWKNK